REMLTAQPFGQRFEHDGIEEGPTQTMILQTLAVLGEGRGVKRRISRLQVQKPAKEQVQINLLAELPFAANRVERHQQQGFEQPLRRHAGTPYFTVRRFKPRMQRLQNV